MKRLRQDEIEALVTQRAQYSSLEALRLSEPRLDLVAERLRALLRVVELESGGEPIEIDAFRLRDPEHWTEIQGSPIAELWHSSTACNMRCPFCYEEGDPAGVSVLNEPAEMMTPAELETRLKYADPATGAGLFRPLTYINEIFCNPDALDMMERIRTELAPDEVFTFVTNGTYLTEPTVARLAALEPIFFNFSVNSLDPRIRRVVLRDRAPETAIAAPGLLRENGIPYLASLVCWPTIPWDDIANTVYELDRAGCPMLRFSLSAFSKHLKRKKETFDRLSFWREGLDLARSLQQEVAMPIKVEPFHFDQPSYEPYLVGTINGSPAARAGMRVADVITHIDGRPMPTANHTLSALAVARRHERARIEVRYRRADREHAVTLDDAAGPFGYPYDQLRMMSGFAWGLILVENLKFSYLEQMRETIDRRGARNVLVCSSELMRPVVEQMLAVSRAFDDIQLTLIVPENHYFGGTIVLGDLLVVDDYVTCLREAQEQARVPYDLVVIPSSPFSLGGWGRDLTGRPWTDIERLAGTAVELIRIRPLNG